MVNLTIAYTDTTCNKCKKTKQFKTVFYGDTAYITQLKQQQSEKGDITFAARRHNVNVLLSNSTFLIFAVLVVWCRPCRR